MEADINKKRTNRMSPQPVVIEPLQCGSGHRAQVDERSLRRVNVVIEPLQCGSGHRVKVTNIGTTQVGVVIEPLQCGSGHLLWTHLIRWMKSVVIEPLQCGSGHGGSPHHKEL